ncbi:MAG: flagellar biosynthesis protein FlhB [Gammaproteobacteria bacterium]|jgi:flagellar biosynthetic protein FlhB|nr:flagellar biosynthesis protein FlhB [Gammaproteobacteria bacterium]
MAESGSGQEKTEPASAKKLLEARQQGQVPRSRELDTLIMLLVSATSFLMLGGQIIGGLLELLRSHFVIERALLFNSGVLPELFWQAVNEGISILVPFFFVMVIAAVIAPLPMGGWNFSTKAWAPKVERLNPIKGLARVFAWKGLIELSKALIKFLIVATAGWFLLMEKLPEFLILGNQPISAALSELGGDLIWVFLLLSCTLIVVAAVDVPFQIWDYHRQQRMTRQEIKDEYKDTDGSPELKSKVRSTQREIAMRRMMENVPKADVVITNPSHYAVALRYNQLNMGAPVVVAAGVDLVALQIRRIASAHDVPIMEAPALARALYHSTKIDQEIPAGLYLAVAQVLAYIYQLKQYQTEGGVQPQAPADLPIPDDLRRD